MSDRKQYVTTLSLALKEGLEKSFVEAFFSIEHMENSVDREVFFLTAGFLTGVSTAASFIQKNGTDPNATPQSLLDAVDIISKRIGLKRA